MKDAKEIVSNEPGSYAWGVLQHRHPALIEQVRDAFPYPPERQRALDGLLEEIFGPIEPLAGDAHDKETWDAWGQGYFGRRWFDVPFLWAENYFYRKLLGAVGFFTDGPWQGIDPFGPFKERELADPSVETELALLDDLASLPATEHDSALIRASLWGNRADLGFRISADTNTTDGDPVTDLVADESAALWSILENAAPGKRQVCLVADNAGRELLPDLILIDHLLRSGRADQVTLHVKPLPYFVSDATTYDAIACLRRLRKAPGQAGTSGTRLWQALTTGQLEIRTHPFYCAPLSYHHTPDDLADEYASATLTIFKGDLNYRRLVGDRTWPATTPFKDVTTYFPGPVATFRTLKSDVIVGLTPSTLTTLESTADQWRTSGTHALIQTRP